MLRHLVKKSFIADFEAACGSPLVFLQNNGRFPDRQAGSCETFLRFAGARKSGNFPVDCPTPFIRKQTRNRPVRAKPKT